MRKIILRIRVAFIRWAVRRLRSLGFTVLPQSRAASAIQQARALEALLRSAGSNFRDRQRRRLAWEYTIGISMHLNAGADEIEGLLEYAVKEFH